MPVFPNVPDVPGVPPVLRSAPFQNILPELLTGDLVGLFNSLTAPQWGIYRFGNPVVVADNVVSLDYRQDWTVANYPIERGGFESYDKVATPFEVRLRFSRGGSIAACEEFLASVEAIAPTLDLYDIRTPERTYYNVNINHYDYRRSSNGGVGLMVIDIFGIEIRLAAESAFVNTQDPTSAKQVNNGTVQPNNPTPDQAAAFSLGRLG